MIESSLLFWQMFPSVYLKISLQYVDFKIHSNIVSGIKIFMKLRINLLTYSLGNMKIFRKPFQLKILQVNLTKTNLPVFWCNCNAVKKILRGRRDLFSKVFLQTPEMKTLCTVVAYQSKMSNLLVVFQLYFNQ